MKNFHVIIEGIKYLKCGEVQNEYGTFEMVTPTGYEDLRTLFFRINKTENGVIYEKLDDRLHEKLVEMYKVPDILF